MIGSRAVTVDSFEPKLRSPWAAIAITRYLVRLSGSLIGTVACPFPSVFTLGEKSASGEKFVRTAMAVVAVETELSLFFFPLSSFGSSRALSAGASRSASSKRAALAAATFLQRWFKTRTLTPFAIYCLVAGAVSIVRFV